VKEILNFTQNNTGIYFLYKEKDYQKKITFQNYATKLKSVVILVATQKRHKKFVLHSSLVSADKTVHITRIHTENFTFQ
jgi:hypothetical protein